MARPRKKPASPVGDPLMDAAVQWLCARYGTDSRAKRKADGDLVDAVVLGMWMHMARPRTADEHFFWMEEILKAACRSEKMLKRLSEAIRRCLSRPPARKPTDGTAGAPEHPREPPRHPQ